MTAISGCRACGHRALRTIADLGDMPLANALRTEQELTKPEERHPLKLVWCPECALAQITETVSPEKLFSHYFYCSSASDTAVAEAKLLVERLVASRGLGAGSLVVEIASNDGYLLQHYLPHRIPVLGIEPAANIAEMARKRGVPTECEFFGEDFGKTLAKRGMLADVIHINNVFPHVADQNDFARGVRAMLKPEGVAIIECADVKHTIDRTEFDQIYHEHLCYFSLTSLDRLLRSNGLAVADAEALAIHGGSLRAFVQHQAHVQPTKAVADMLAEEKRWGVATPEPYLAFAKRIELLKSELVAMLAKLKSAGKRIAAYGASAKGSTLMNFAGIGRGQIDYVVDRNPLKQGHYTPGTGLAVHPAEKLLADMPEYTLLLTWNFADEILAQQAEYRNRGGKFIVPVPSPVIV